jgi:hypothetical protein
MAKEPHGCEGRENTDVPVFGEDRVHNSRYPRREEAPLGHGRMISVRCEKLKPGRGRCGNRED